MTNLRLAGNLHTGSIPNGIGKLTKLVELDLTSNQISGSIPNFFSSFTQLRHVYLSNNKLTGNIPPSVADLPHNLYYFEAANNDLTGQIPSFFVKFQELLKLDLSRNHFPGTVPKSFENMTMLGNLDLSYNNLAGPFPTLNKDRISEINLSYNQFHLGTIPEWITTALSLNTIGLAKCGIKFNLDMWNTSDPLNTYFLYNIDISENQVSGGPKTFSNATPFLREFRDSGNKLKFNMGRLKLPKNLETLDLSRNLVFGNVPKAVAHLTSLNVSHNHLCGFIPATKFPTSSFAGNDCLCGAPLSPCKA